jgi:hypothetical protein
MMAQLISIVMVLGLLFLGAIYLFGVISGSRKPGDYEGLTHVSSAGAFLLVVIGGTLLGITIYKEIVGQAFIRAHQFESSIVPIISFNNVENLEGNRWRKK